MRPEIKKLEYIVYPPNSFPIKINAKINKMILIRIIKAPVGRFGIKELIIKASPVTPPVTK